MVLKIIFFIGVVNLILFFFFYFKWLFTFSRVKKESIIELFNKGIILPYYVNYKNTEFTTEFIKKLNRYRSYMIAFLVGAFLLTIIYNILIEIKA